MQYQPLDDVNLLPHHEYAITVQLPAFKKVNYKGVYKRFDKFHSYEQEFILIEELREAYNKHIDVNSTQHQPIDFRFEEHQDGRMHLHGVIRDLCEWQMESIKQSYCKKFGIKELEKQSYIFYYRIMNDSGWLAYINKNQDVMAQLEKELAELDKK